MKAKLTDEASKSVLAKLSGWSDVAGNDVASRVIRMSFSHRCAPLGPTVELRSFGVKQCDELRVTHGLAFGVPLPRGIRSRRTAELCAKICTRKPAPNPLVHRHTRRRRSILARCS
jgi:hypothetical protein